MYDFLNFTMVDAVNCGREIRHLGSNARSMEDAANELVQFFYENFIEKESETKSCVLVRFFKMHDYNHLGDDLKIIARKSINDACFPENFMCLTLLATRGTNPEWNSRHASVGHQAIPLMDTESVDKIPMIKNLIKQMGLEVGSVLEIDSKLMTDLSQKTFNVFHVPDASDGYSIPAQENFIKPYGVKSVLGFGGVLPSGHLFSMIIFSRTFISPEVANRFITVTLNMKMVVMPFAKRVFSSN